MFMFLLQFRELVTVGGPIYLFFILSVLVWISWLVKVYLSRKYRPWTEPHSEKTSVIIPVVDEPIELFRDVLTRIVEQNPDEIIVVINGAKNQKLEDECARYDHVTCLWTPKAGKRGAIKLGVEASSHPITVLVDSDTIWTPGVLSELIKPFAESRVGGVTTRQRILNPDRTWISRWADWLENSRALYSMPAQSVLGQVGCLPGRTIAFRRQILVDCMDDFMTEKFLGVHLEVSDDRTLTNYTLKQGYRTVYQSTALVYTDVPETYKKLYKQQLRWARGSTYNTARMMPWMLTHTPVLAFFFALDIAIPFLLLGAIAGWIIRAVTNTGVNFYQPMLNQFPGLTGILIIIGLVVIGSFLSMSVRQLRHVKEKPGDLLKLPVFILASTFLLMPIRILGFVKMAHAASWSTREGSYNAKHHHRKHNWLAGIPYIVAALIIGVELYVSIR